MMTCRENAFLPSYPHPEKGLPLVHSVCVPVEDLPGSVSERRRGAGMSGEGRDTFNIKAIALSLGSGDL